MDVLARLVRRTGWSFRFKAIEKHKTLGLNTHTTATRKRGSILGWIKSSDSPSNVESHLLISILASEITTATSHYRVRTITVGPPPRMKAWCSLLTLACWGFSLSRRISHLRVAFETKSHGPAATPDNEKIGLNGCTSAK